jgi:glycerophosphoryl diester phosphodiesterase
LILGDYRYQPLNPYDISMTQPLIIAHRTCPLDAPENSLAGIRIAAEHGSDGVEIDLRMSLDQQPLLFHDSTMRRTTGFRLPLEATPSPVARRLRLEGSGEQVPSLAEALDELPSGLLLAVDVKTPWAIVPLMREVKRRDMEQRVLVWCTSALAVRYAVRVSPRSEVAYLKDSRDERGKRDFVWKAKRLGAGAISAHWLAIDAAFVALAHDYGLKVYSYHAGYDLTPERLRAGLDGLITDIPRQARAAWLAANAAPQN